MFKINRNKKTSAVIAGGVLAVATAGGAYAYWTALGEGTGSAATTDGAASLFVEQTSTIAGMFPGDAPQTITGKVTNNAGNSAFVGTVTAKLVSVTQAADAKGVCTIGDYTLTNDAMLVNKDVATKAGVVFSGAKIQFNNKPEANQDGCKGATVNLSYTVS